jgi:predicted  nucleic acid-binding Zn-ribbon protein
MYKALKYNITTKVFGFLLIFNTNVFANECDLTPSDSHEAEVCQLKKEIVSLKIKLAELEYDVDDLKQKNQKLTKNSNLCELNLKNVKQEFKACLSSRSQ